MCIEFLALRGGHGSNTKAIILFFFSFFLVICYLQNMLSKQFYQVPKYL